MRKLLTFGALAAAATTPFWIDARASAREAQGEADYPPIGQLLDVDGTQVHAYVTGDGPDLVLIHGAGGNLRDFAFSFADRLSANYRVIAFDRPGLGYTDRIGDGYGGAFSSDAESPREQAALLQAAAQQLGADKPIVLGHSFGGAVAYAWAVYHPDNISGLVSVAGVTLPWPGDLGYYYTVPGSSVGGAIVPPLVTAFVSQERVQRGITSTFDPNPMPAGYDEFIGAPLTIRRESFRANARQVNGVYPHIVEQSAFYDQIAVPVAMVHGDADTSVPLSIHSQPASEIIPDVELTVLTGVGHMPHHVDPGAVEAAINSVAARAGLR